MLKDTKAASTNGEEVQSQKQLPGSSDSACSGGMCGGKSEPQAQPPSSVKLAKASCSGDMCGQGDGGSKPSPLVSDAKDKDNLDTVTN